MSKNDSVEDLLRKLKEYPIGRETSFVFGSGNDPVSLAQRITNLERGMSIILRQIDLIRAC